MNKHPLDRLMNMYFQEKDITKDTKSLYQTILNQYVTYLTHEKIYYPKSKDIDTYLRLKKQAHYSPKWIRHHITVLKDFYKYLSVHHMRLGIHPRYRKDITLHIKNIKAKNAKPTRVLSIESVRVLLKCLSENRRYIIDDRDYAMILLMLTTGMRSIEIRRAKISDLKRLGNQHILYVQVKGKVSSDAFIKLTSTSYQAIETYLKRRKDRSPYVFISHGRGGNHLNVSRAFIYTIIRKRMHQCNLRHLNIHPHMLRHTAAMLTLESGNSLQDIKELLRHQSVETTLIYTHNMHARHMHASQELESFIFDESKETS